MSKPLKSLVQYADNQLIKNQWSAALVRPAEATPLADPGPARARRDPPGGHPAPHSLPPVVTPCSIFGPNRLQKNREPWSRIMGLGGACPSLRLQGQADGRTVRVRT